jgi:hypothetical protein
VSGEQVRALYFGSAFGAGHHLYSPDSPRARSPSEFPGFPWNYAHLDAGLLQLMGKPDVCDGAVASVARGAWWAFVWWDRSGDPRAGSNSGLYVRGFGEGEGREAFAHARLAFPGVVGRQPFALRLE